MITNKLKQIDECKLIIVAHDLKAAIEKLNCGDQYFKIAYNVSWGSIIYETKAVAIQGPVLAVSSKRRKCRWEGTSLPGEGRFCLFTQEFIDLHDRSKILNLSSLYNQDIDAVFYLNPDQQTRVKQVFQNIEDELRSSYTFKYDLVFNYLNILVHESVKMHPAEVFDGHQLSALRIFKMFTNLLESQFPIKPDQPKPRLKTPAQYAEVLRIHTNYLNSAVKEVSGKTTSACIGDRVAKEAKKMLKEPYLSISEIAYALGFEYPSYFNNFFKKATGTVPSVFR